MSRFRGMCRAGRIRLVHGETANRTEDRNKEPETSQSPDRRIRENRICTQQERNPEPKCHRDRTARQKRLHRTSCRDLPRRPEVVSDRAPGLRAVVVGGLAPRRVEPELERGTAAAGGAQPPAGAVLTVVARETEAASGVIVNWSRQAPRSQLATSLRPDASDAGTARRSAPILVRQLVRGSVGDDAGPGDARKRGSLPTWSPDMGTSRSDNASGRHNDCQHSASPSR